MNYPIRLRRFNRTRRTLFARSCARVRILTVLAVQIINLVTQSSKRAIAPVVRNWQTGPDEIATNTNT